MIFAQSEFAAHIFGPVERSGFDKKIEALTLLPNGWEYGTGEPVSRDMAARAKRWHSFALGNSVFTKFDAFASSGGDLLITMYRGKIYAEIFLEQNGYASLRALNGEEEIFESGPKRDLELRKDFLELATGAVCKLLGIYTHSTTTQSVANSSQLHFSNPVPSAGTVSCLYSTSTVLMPVANLSVTTSGSFILEPANLQSIGDSTPPPYLKATA